MKRALIFGVTGQDGSYLAEFLLQKDYEVHGVVRRASTINTSRIDHLYRDPHQTDSRFYLHYGDLTDSDAIKGVISKVKPHEIYNLAAQSHVRISFDMPLYTSDVVGLGALRVLNAVRDLELDCRIYQASSSEMFGSAPAPQSETTPFKPRSPYGCAKVFAYHAAVNYREAYGMFISNGILFNHESERRGETFVTRKITRALGRISVGTQDKLYLGNLEALRDWGYAPDYVEAMWMMLQHNKPDDFVIGTGVTYSVKEFLETAIHALNRYQSSRLDRFNFVVQDEKYRRPTEVDVLQADARKAASELGFYPKTTFKTLVEKMVIHDLKLAQREAI